MEKKILIFDLDGVLINSKNNMLSAWQYTNKINNLNILMADLLPISPG